MTKHIQRLRGAVVSAKMQKTVVVEVTRLKQHPKYRKYMHVSKRYKAHSDRVGIKEGDRVTIELTRPLSKEKCWRVIEKNT